MVLYADSLAMGLLNVFQLFSLPLSLTFLVSKLLDTMSALEKVPDMQGQNQENIRDLLTASDLV